MTTIEMTREQEMEFYAEYNEWLDEVYLLQEYEDAVAEEDRLRGEWLRERGLI